MTAESKILTFPPLLEERKQKHIRWHNALLPIWLACEANGGKWENFEYFVHWYMNQDDKVQAEKSRDANNHAK